MDVFENCGIPISKSELPLELNSHIIETGNSNRKSGNSRSNFAIGSRAHGKPWTQWAAFCHKCRWRRKIYLFFWGGVRWNLMESD